MNRATIKKLYREAILQVFGTGDKVQDKYLLDAVKRDIHLGDQAPGQWSPDSVLEIYCEGGIPNATDIFDPSWHGFPVTIGSFRGVLLLRHLNNIQY